MAKVTVVGATSWGITLGMTLAHKGVGVYLWVRTEEESTRLKNGGINSAAVADVTFPPEVSKCHFASMSFIVNSMICSKPLMAFATSGNSPVPPMIFLINSICSSTDIETTHVGYHQSCIKM